MVLFKMFYLKISLPLSRKSYRTTVLRYLVKKTNISNNVKFYNNEKFELTHHFTATELDGHLLNFLF